MRKKNLMNGLKIAGVYTGLILGAGFASGQELLKFFVVNGTAGYAGLALTGVLFGLLGWAVLDICYKHSIESYEQFSAFIFGPVVGKLIEHAVAMFLLVLFATMLAAGGAAVREAFGFPEFYGVVGLAVFCFVCFLFGLNGLVEINSILAPLMVVGGIFIGLYTLFLQSTPVFNELFVTLNPTKWIFQALTYVCYNIVTAVSVLSTMGKLNCSRKTAMYGGLWGGLAMGLLGVCLAIPLFIHMNDVFHLEIPMLYITNQYGNLIKYLFLLILLAAIITTAIGNGYAFIQWVEAKSKISSVKIKILTVLLAVGLSGFGFSSFVSRIYPIFGIFGLIQIIYIFRFWMGVRK